MRHRRTLAALAAACTALAGCAIGGSTASGGFTDYVTIALNTPQSKLPFVAKFTQQGAQLAMEQINKAGGIKVGGKTYGLKLESMDNELSPSKSLDNIKKAVADKVVAVIDDGYTTDATYKTAGDAGLPILVDYDSNAALIDTQGRPNVFRISPPNDAMAMHLADYVTKKGLKLAIAHDDSEYGVDGHDQLVKAFQAKGVTFAPDVTLPSNATDYQNQALQVQISKATGVLVWARAPVLAQFVKSLRQNQFSGQIFSGPTAEDPIVRTQNADHPEYITGLTYASWRITTEGGPEAWGAFRKKYEDRNFNDGGPDFHVGVKASDGKDVVQPPDWHVFPYDMVYLVKAALEQAGTVSTSGNKLIDALNTVKIKSANGDNRGWTKDNHEGIVDDDIYYATFADMKFKPVQDDPLSASLPPIDQE